MPKLLTTAGGEAFSAYLALAIATFGTGVADAMHLVAGIPCAGTTALWAVFLAVIWCGERRGSRGGLLPWGIRSWPADVRAPRVAPTSRSSRATRARVRGGTMKYMILTYASQQDYDGMAGKAAQEAAWSGEDFAAMGAFMESFNRDLDESGELVETRGLLDPVHTRRVRLQKGVPVVTDGPYAETAEVLAGYWIVECESFDRATEIAARLSECPGPEQAAARAYADVRPIAESRAELGV